MPAINADSMAWVSDGARRRRTPAYDRYTAELEQSPGPISRFPVKRKRRLFLTDGHSLNRPFFKSESDRVQYEIQQQNTDDHQAFMIMGKAPPGPKGQHANPYQY